MFYKRGGIFLKQRSYLENRGKDTETTTTRYTAAPLLVPLTVMTQLQI